MKAAIKDLTFNREGKQIVSLELDKSEDFRPLYDKYNGKILALDIKEYKQKRSINANNYAWKLITELANETRASKDEVYMLMLARYGQSAKIDLKADIEPQRYFDYFKQIDVNGDYITYFVCVGSSKYDTHEMAIFIDGIVSECKQLGIPTETPEEIERIKSLWQNTTTKR
jgi:hypothetical protein